MFHNTQEKYKSQYDIFDRFCGYCGKFIRTNLAGFLIHTITCEKDCCDRVYGKDNKGKR
jgi:hypothetical protein